MIVIYNIIQRLVKVRIKLILVVPIRHVVNYILFGMETPIPIKIPELELVNMYLVFSITFQFLFQLHHVTF